MKRLSEWIGRLSTGWVALFAFIIFLLFTALVLPAQASRAEADSGGADSPDTSFYYTADELYRMAEAYGEEGRRAYIRVRFTFDLVWPLVYTTFLCTGISWIFRRAFDAGALWQRANLAPLLAALFDLLENGSTSLVMARYPSATGVIDSLAPLFTMVKWILVGASILLLLAGAAVAAWRTFRAARTRQGRGLTDET